MLSDFQSCGATTVFDNPTVYRLYWLRKPTIREAVMAYSSIIADTLREAFSAAGILATFQEKEGVGVFTLRMKLRCRLQCAQMAVLVREDAYSSYTTLPFFTSNTLEESLNFIPRLVKASVSTLQISGSVAPAILGIISMTVTVTPTLAK